MKITNSFLLSHSVAYFLFYKCSLFLETLSCDPKSRLFIIIINFLCLCPLLLTQFLKRKHNWPQCPTEDLSRTEVIVYENVLAYESTSSSCICSLCSESTSTKYLRGQLSSLFQVDVQMSTSRWGLPSPTFLK